MFILTNEEHKIEIQLLKDHLVDNYVVYHERVTLLLQLTVFDIQDTHVSFKAKIIKPLDRSKAETNGLYQDMMSKEEISFSAPYLWGQDESSPLLNGKMIARGYCPFILWLDPELSLFVLNNEDEVINQIPTYILSSNDWRILKESKG